MEVDPAKHVWRGKWAEVTASFDSYDEENDEDIAAGEVSLSLRQGSGDNGNEIRRSARPRRVAAKAAEADFSSMSADGPHQSIAPPIFTSHGLSRHIVKSPQRKKAVWPCLETDVAI